MTRLFIAQPLEIKIDEPKAADFASLRWQEICWLKELSQEDATQIVAKAFYSEHCVGQQLARKAFREDIPHPLKIEFDDGDASTPNSLRFGLFRVIRLQEYLERRGHMLAIHAVLIGAIIKVGPEPVVKADPEPAP